VGRQLDPVMIDDGLENERMVMGWRLGTDITSTVIGCELSAQNWVLGSL
jgi:hypothetical protein